MTEKYISFFSLVVRLDKLLVLNVLKSLNFGFNNGVCGVGIDGFWVNVRFNFGFSFLFQFDF
jgi:hypothetical protein